MRPWHLTAKAQSILSRIDPADVLVLESHDAIHSDGLYLAADERTEKALNAIRHAAADKAAGYTFASAQEPFDREASLRWMDALDRAGPSVAEALECHFGSLDPYRGFSRAEATTRWRIAARAALARELAA